MRAWIFQGVPSRYDVAKKLKPGKKEDWVASSGFREMRPGDVVFFWRASERQPERRGLYGWGKIVAEPVLDDEEGNWVTVKYVCVFPEFIPYATLAANKQFRTHQLFSMPIGTNFSLTDEQLQGLLAEIRATAGEECVPKEDK